MKKYLNKSRICFFAVVLTLCIDQITKYFALYIKKSDPLVNNYHIISLFEKITQFAGAHFFLINVGHYFEGKQLLIRLVVLPLIGLYITYFIVKKQISTRWVFLGVGMLLGALLGNGLDIIFRGFVVDWFGCSFFMHNFELNYAINFADIIAVLSAPIILIGMRKTRIELRIIANGERAVMQSGNAEQNIAA